MATKFLNGITLNNQRAQAVADPSSATDAATKQYVDNMVHGLAWKQPVRVATTANGALATDFDDGTSIDGVSIATGDRILIKNQSTQTENGIYVVAASGAPTRSTDADSTAELNAATVKVMAGTVNAEKSFTQTTDNVTIGTHNVVWAEIGGGTTYTADGQGIELNGTAFELELNGATLSKGASGLKVNDAYAGNGLAVSSDVLAVGAGSGITVNANDVALASSSGGDGLTYTTGVLAVGAGSGITVAADSVAVDTSVVARKFSASIGNGSSTSIAVTHNLGTKDVVVQVRENSGDAHVYADVVSTDTNNVTVDFATAPASNAIRVTVIG